MQRRSFLASIGSGSTLLVSGCLSSSRSEPTVRVTPTCREVTQERTKTVYDELESWDAGDYYTWSLSLAEDEAVLINAVRVEGARPALTIKNPDGDTVVQVEPAETIRRRFAASTAGTYYVTLENEAMMSSGQWDVEITTRHTYTVERCD